jgi:KTSC domain
MLRRLLVCLGVLSLVVRAPLFAEPSPTANHVVSHIPRQRIESSAIAAVGYSKRRHILEIEFVNGAIYRYLDVPPTVHGDLMSAESKARFYDSKIRKHYRSVLVQPRHTGQSGN